MLQPLLNGCCRLLEAVMSFEWGKVEIPKYLPLGAIVMLSIIGTLAWADLHTKADQTARQLAAAERQRELLTSEFKAKDAELDKLAADNADEEEVLKGLPESIRKRIEEDRQARKAAEDQIAKMKVEAEEREAIEKAKAFGVGEPGKIGPLLMRVAKGRSGAEDAAELERLFKSFGEIASKSPLFKSIGTDVKVDGDPEEILKAKAAEIRKERPSLTPEQAYAAAMDANPEVYSAYVAKHRQKSAA